MEKITYNKLVRDGIPDKIRKNGGKCKVRTLSQDGHIQSLFAKTEEERLEFVAAETKEQRLAEAADLIEVVLKIWDLGEIGTFHQKLFRKNFLQQFAEDSVNLHVELEQHTLELQTKLGDVSGIARATAAQVEALLYLIAQDGYTGDDLNNQIIINHEQRGGFDKGYFLVWATAP